MNDIGIEALLFQTGYLTIAEEWEEGHRTSYRLDYPNLEVKLSLNDELLAHLGNGRLPLDEGRDLRGLLEANDFKRFAERLRSYLSGIPYQWHATGDLARYEAWYASLLHMCFRAHRGGRPCGGRVESRPSGHDGSDGRSGVRHRVQDGRRRKPVDGFSGGRNSHLTT